MSNDKQKEIILKWSEEGGEFRPIESEADMNEGIFVKLIVEERKWKYFYIKGASLIARRTALRSANGIAKTGYVHPIDGIRYGTNCKIEEEVSPYENMPENIKKSQRSWYKGDYKQY
ncbi:MAG: hypothetical protein ACTSRI_19450 [Promethearchaeota archaeon]